MKAERARDEYANALHLFPASADGWTPRVLTCSALANQGIAEIWSMVLEHRNRWKRTAISARRRSAQALEWMNELVLLALEESFRGDTAVAARLPQLQADVRAGRATPFAASSELLALFSHKKAFI